ncbi:MAG TPA: tryptophan synthase subunit alpha [Acidimicrobiales bacterium]|nr:tryptophan synthase subunit alpha [Acidimicrobiales bacterium]
MSGNAAGPLERPLRARRDLGYKLIVPYITGGLDDRWVDVVVALAGAGADAIEVGIPFSDPVMDGPVIQEASVRALRRNTTPQSIISELAQLDCGVPLAVMTYVNLFAHAGFHRMAYSLRDAGVAGVILPDLPIDEAGDWMSEAEGAGIDAVQLVAPTTPDERLTRICRASQGFVYAIGLLGVTGEREELASSAAVIARRCKTATSTPVLVGVGVSNPEQAVAICQEADGVVIGSALVRRLLDGEGVEGATKFIGEMREVLDRRWPGTRS